MKPETKWILSLAWRDSRGSRARLLLCMSAIVLGVAALVAVGSLGASLRSALDDQSKTLLGADLVVRRNAPFDEAATELIESLGNQRSKRVSFSSMALFPKLQVTQLVEVRAVESGFPFYGAYETRPATAGRVFPDKTRGVLVDRTLMLQYGVQVGDPVKIGEVTFDVAGELLTVPGESASLSTLGARIFIPLELLEATALVRVGSRVSYSVYYRLPAGIDADQLVDERREDLSNHDLRTTTVSERRQNLARSLDNLNRFLSLAGFVALVLGGIGVASSINLYVKQRMDTVAILRCVGATSRNCIAVYLLQCGVTAAAGALLGAALGVGIQFILPHFFSNLLPAGFSIALSWRSIGQGIGVGLGIAMLFVLLPLAPLRRVSPLRALRAEFSERSTGHRDPVTWLLLGIVLAGLLLFSWLHTSRWSVALGFFGGLVVAIGLLLGLAFLLTWLLRHTSGRGWRYELRQGLANLYRPHNQTTVLILALGLGTIFVLTLLVVENSLMAEVSRVSTSEGPNLIFFDVQSDQKAAVRQLIESEALIVEHDVPIVTMRLAAINGRPVKEIQRDGSSRAQGWTLRREYRCTYRGELDDTEELVAGRLQQHAEGDRILVSLEAGLANSLAVQLGDQLTFDVAGLAVRTEVGSLRRVRWDTFQTNFFIVFPPDVLESAPQFHVLVTRTETDVQSARLQRAVVERYPNVSAIDLGLVVETINSMLDRVMLVLRVMALVTVLTGLVVLAGAVAAGRYQRRQEHILLRTLGASAGQLRRILIAEYLLLGLLSAGCGLLLAMAGSWALTEFVFEIPLQVPLGPLAAVSGGVVAVTLAVGVFNNRGMLRQPPLASLRAEI